MVAPPGRIFTCLCGVQLLLRCRKVGSILWELWIIEMTNFMLVG